MSDPQAKHEGTHTGYFDMPPETLAAMEARQKAPAELPIQRATRERLLDGMCGIIRRMSRVSPAGVLCLADHDEREVAIALLGYLEGRNA